MKRSFPLAVCLLLASHVASATAADLVVPPSGKIGKSSQEEWSAYWWQWAGFFDDSNSPIAELLARKSFAPADLGPGASRSRLPTHQTRLTPHA